MLIICLLDLDAEDVEGFPIDGARAVRHELGGVLHLREGGDVPETVGAAHQHRDAVEADAHAAVRRSAVLVRFDKEAELGLDLLVGELEGAEHLLLQLIVGDADGAGAELGAVEGQVIGLGDHLAGVALEILQALLARHGEGMVHRDPLAALLVLLNEREVHDPEEVIRVLRDQVELATQLQTQRTEHRERDAVLVGDDEDHVALLGAEDGEDALEVALAEELAERAGGLILRPADVGETLGADALDILGELVDLLAGEGCGGVLRDDGAHRAAVFDRAFKDDEVDILHGVAQVDQRHAEAHVGLVGAVGVHRGLIGHALKGRGQLDALHLSEQALHEPLVDLHDILDIDEAQLHIDLGELGLAVGAEILVAEAARELDIAVEARHHQELLVDLGRLGQGVELAGMDARGHEIVAGALGRGFDHHRGLDLDEAVLVEIVAGDLGDARASDQVLLQRRASEVEIAVFEPDILAGLAVIHDLKGRGLRLREHAQIGHLDLDVTGGDLVGFGGALAHPAHRAQDILRAGGERLVKDRAVGAVVERELDDAGAVAQVDEDELAEVALTLNPAADRDGLADVFTSQGAAVMGAL